MNVTHIRVSFGRKKQPAQYEEASPFVEMTAAVDEGQDHMTILRDLMLDAERIVYAALGYDVPNGPLAKLNEIVGVASGEPTPAEPAAPPKATKRSKAAAKKTEPEKPAAPTATQDIPDGPAGRAISDNPEDRRAPDDDIPDDGAKPARAEVSDIPEGPPAAKPATGSPGKVPDDAALQTLITNRITSRKITPPRMKEIMMSFGAERTSEMPKDKRLAFVAAVDEECAKAGAKG